MNEDMNSKFVRIARATSGMRWDGAQTLVKGEARIVQVARNREGAGFRSCVSWSVLLALRTPSMRLISPGSAK
jgi:hypothetical protein